MHDSNNPSENSIHSFHQTSTLELAQLLAERLMLTSGKWHRLKSNRKARALEQAAISLVFLLKDQHQEALVRLQQATGWLDKSVMPLPCPTHGHTKANPTLDQPLDPQI